MLPRFRKLPDNEVLVLVNDLPQIGQNGADQRFLGLLGCLARNLSVVLASFSPSHDPTLATTISNDFNVTVISGINRYPEFSIGLLESHGPFSLIVLPLWIWDDQSLPEKVCKWSVDICKKKKVFLCN